MAIQEEIAYEINRNKIGQSLRVMIDREDSDYYVGRTQYDSPEVDPEVLVEKRSHLSVGNFYDIQITDAQPFELIGVPKDWQNESL